MRDRHSHLGALGRWLCLWPLPLFLQYFLISATGTLLYTARSFLPQ